MYDLWTSGNFCNRLNWVAFSAGMWTSVTPIDYSDKKSTSLIQEKAFQSFPKHLDLMNTLLFPQASSKLPLQVIILFPSSIKRTKDVNQGCFWSRTATSLSRHLITHKKALSSLTMQETLHAWRFRQGTRCLSACLQDVMLRHVTALPPLAAFCSVKFKKWLQKPVLN